MKKFKYFTFSLLSALCLFAVLAFCGCKQKSYYIEDTFTYTIDNNYYSFYTVEGDFKVYVPAVGKYTVEYTLTTNGRAGTKSTNVSFNLMATKGGEQTVDVRCTFDTVSGQSNSTAQISDVVITKNEVEDNYTPYAIGFGATAGVILVGAVVVFALDKAGVLKKKR